MDLANLTIPDTVEVHIEFPDPKIGKLYADDERKLPVIIELHSPASDEAVAYKHKVQRQVTAKIGKKGLRGFNNLSPEDTDKQNVERLCAFTASVKNMLFDGKKITVSTIKDIYANPRYSWICDQLNEKLGSWEDFLG